MAPCFWKIFEKSNQPSQQLSLWMKQWTFHYSKFVVNSNALKTDKIPNFANLSAPNSEKNHPSTTKKRRPCATRKPQLLPKVQQTTLHPCTKGTSMRHNVVCFETTISSKKSYTYPKFLHGWNLKMFFFWKGHFFLRAIIFRFQPSVFRRWVWHDCWFLPNMWMTFFFRWIPLSHWTNFPVTSG